jgi:hypothetical protein
MRSSSGFVRAVGFGIAIAFSVTSAREAAAAITAFLRAGSQSDSTAPPLGPGLVVMGGDVDSAFVWMHDVLTGSSTVSGADCAPRAAAAGLATSEPRRPRLGWRG